MKKSKFSFTLKHSPNDFRISKMESWIYSVPRQYFLASLECKLSVGLSLNFSFRYSKNLVGLIWTRQLRKSKALGMFWSKIEMTIFRISLL